MLQMIVLDARERELAKFLEEGSFRTETLVLGDVLVLDAEGKVALAVERKTSADLRASLRDGRYSEQRARMVEEYGANAAYVIEGHEGFETDVAGALTGLMFRSRIVTVKTKNIEETAAFLKHVAMAAANGRLCQTTSPSRSNAPKRKATTPAEIGSAMLSAIPGVSIKTADELIARFESLANIIDHVKSNGLCNEKVGGRRLGKVGDRIAATLLGAA